MNRTTTNVIKWNEQARDRALKQGRKGDAARHQANIDGLRGAGA